MLSITLPVKDTIPLYCIVSKHGLDDVYQWLHDQQANTPVLWINLPGVYSCSVTRESRVCKSNAISVEWKHVHQSDSPLLGSCSLGRVCNSNRLYRRNSV